jgi:DNA modification methylase
MHTTSTNSASLSLIDPQAVTQLLATHRYDEVQAMTGLSKGTIYRIAKAAGARKTEARIRQRAAERRREQVEFLQSMIDSTAKADVLDFLADIPNDSVDCHISSAPYNLGVEYGGCPGADSLRFVFFHGWLMQVISELARTVRPGGLVCLNVGKTIDHAQTLMPMDVLLFEDLRRAGLTFQSRIAWTQEHGLTPRKRLAERYETILVFSKGSTPTFNPNAARRPQKQPGKRAYKGPNKGKLSGHPYGAFPTDVWNDIPAVRANHPDRRHGDHPAMFPAALAKRLILLYTMPGQLVCDVFCGSGSTCQAAIEAGRHFTGADLFYEAVRDKRLLNAVPDTYTPLMGVTDESLAIWQAEAKRVDRHAAAVSSAEDAVMCRDLFERA